LLSHYGFAIKGNPHECIKEITFELPQEHVVGRLACLNEAQIPEVLQADAQGRKVTVRLTQGLRRDVLETPLELLRVAYCLCHGQDYDEEAATCGDKHQACRAVFRALRRMLRSMASPQQLNPNGAPAKRRSSGRGSLSVLGPSARRFHRAARGSKATTASTTSASGLLRMVGMYTRARRRILKAGVTCAQNEAELAELTMNMGFGGADGSEQSDAELDETGFNMTSGGVDGEEQSEPQSTEPA